MEGDQLNIQNSAATSNSVVDQFFGSLIELSKKLDSEVSVLETRVKSQVSRASSSKDGEFSAPIADDINDELNDLNRQVFHK